MPDPLSPISDLNLGLASKFYSAWETAVSQHHTVFHPLRLADRGDAREGSTCPKLTLSLVGWISSWSGANTCTWVWNKRKLGTLPETLITLLILHELHRITAECVGRIANVQTAVNSLSIVDRQRLLAGAHIGMDVVLVESDSVIWIKPYSKRLYHLSSRMRNKTEECVFSSCDPVESRSTVPILARRVYLT